MSVPASASPLRDVFAFLFRQWWRRPGWPLLITLAMAAATVTEVFIPREIGRLVDALGAGAAGRPQALSAFFAMTGLGFAMIVCRFIAWGAVVPMTLRIMGDVAAEAFHRVQRLSSDWHANSFAGSVQRKITRGMWAIDSLDDVLLLALWPSLTVLVGSVAMMAWRAPLLGGVMALGAISYIVVAVLASTRWIAPAARLSNAWDTRIGGVLADALGSNAVVKAFAGEAREDARLGQVVAKWQRRTRRTWGRHVWTGSGLLALLWLQRSAVTGGALWLWWRGQASVGDITYAITAYLVVHGYLRDIGQYVNELQRAVNEMEELVRLHDEPLGVADQPAARPLAITGGEIRLEGVTFGYGPGLDPLYRDFSVTIPAGQRVGLVGHSGSGKTSFVKLVQRLYEVEAGRITIDGQDVRAATQESLRRGLAIVPQEPILFHRSLAENIAYARPDATMAQIEAAARLANAHDFIARLPRGYHTPVGERGVKLSGGERQRVALARAFLADAPILILDEATSSLDSESEALIAEAMHRLLVGRTAIVIAHRLSTVQGLDRILVFDRGRIVEDGSHAALLARDGGAYRRLFERQAGVVAVA